MLPRLSEECTKSLTSNVGSLSQAEHTLKRRKVVNEEAVQHVLDLKKLCVSIQKLLAAVTSPSVGSVTVEPLEASIESTQFNDLWKPPLAVLAAMVRCMVLTKVKYNRWEEIPAILDLESGRMASVISGETNLEFNNTCAELCLGKAAPRVGRSCRPPQELGEQLFALAEVFQQTSIVSETTAAAFKELSVALAKVDMAELEGVKRSYDALEALASTNFPEDNVLSPVVQLTSFKELRKLCVRDAKGRIDELTKSITLADAEREVSLLESGKPVRSTKAVICLQRASRYVMTLTLPHNDIEKYGQTLDRLTNVMGIYLNDLDGCLADAIEAYTSGAAPEGVSHQTKAEQYFANVNSLSCGQEMFAHRQESAAIFAQYFRTAAQRKDFMQDFVALARFASEKIKVENAASDDLATVMSMYGRLADKMNTMECPCCSRVVQALADFKKSLNIDTLAADLYQVIPDNLYK